jgi:hypothetical protein
MGKEPIWRIVWVDRLERQDAHSARR